MPKINFGKPYGNIDLVEYNENIAQELVNGYVSESGAYVSIPGLKLLSTITGNREIQGLYTTINNITIFISDGYVYELNQDGTYIQYTGIRLIPGYCSFAEDRNNVFVAHGASIAKLDLVNRKVELLTVDTPGKVTHVAWVQGYLIANGVMGGSLAGDTYYTGPDTTDNYLTVWERYNNEAIPDDVTAIATDGQLIYNFGSKSVEIAINTGAAISPWARYTPAFIPYGTISGATVVKVDNTFFWLGVADNAVRILKIKGSAAETVSTPYDKIINNLTDHKNSRAMLMGIEGRTFYVISWPGDKLTLAYNIQTDTWSRWGAWDIQHAEFDIYQANCCTYNSAWSKHIIGDRKLNKLYTLEGTNNNGEPLVFRLTSGNTDWDNQDFKRSNRLSLKMKRGFTSSLTSEPFVLVQFRDDNGEWQTEKRVSLGQRGHIQQLQADLWNNGIFRYRQYRITHSDLYNQFIILDAYDDVKVLK